MTVRVSGPDQPHVGEGGVRGVDVLDAAAAARHIRPPVRHAVPVRRHRPHDPVLQGRLLLVGNRDILEATF